MQSKTLSVASCALALTLSSTAEAHQVSGRVQILEKDGVKRDTVRETLVYLEGAQAPIPAAIRNRKASIRSENKTFTPHVEAVPAGAEVTFPNLDDIMHNVFSITKGNRFDLGLYKSGASKSNIFETPGVVRVYCNIHPQMSAVVLVMDNPFYAWAQPDGSFRLENVPAGTYTLRVWNEQGESSAPVTVTEAGLHGLALSIDVSGFEAKPHLNKFGKPYKRKRGKY